MLATTLAGPALLGPPAHATSAPNIAASPADATLPEGLSLLVTEIAPDNAGYDNFEFVEITNTSQTDIDLVAAGVAIEYTFVDDSTRDADRDKVLAITDDTATVAAGDSALLWLQYTSSTVDSFAYTDEEFRAAVGAAPDVSVFHLTGQPGMANGGNRGIRLVDADGATVTWSFYPARATTPDASTHFGRPADQDGVRAHVYRDMAPFTAGTVEREQLEPPDPGEPTPTPTPTPTPGPGVPEPGPVPPADPNLEAPILQITEVAPDTTNVDGADAYEFIEVYNGSDAPISFGDFTINYLYITADRAITNSALWPAVPSDPVIQPGRTLVLWIKNGRNDSLTAADFNAHFGSRLTAGEDLVEIFVGGMANGGLRGIQVQTNTGHKINRADYLTNDQTVPDEPIHYRWDGGSDQTLVATGVATPGYAAPDQVPAGLVATPADTTTPTVSDLTGSTDAPDTDGLALDFEVTDDQQVRTVELTIENNVDEPATRLLRFDAPSRYGYTIPAVDLFGKRWVQYTLRATDGTNETVLGPVRVQLRDGEPAPVRLDLADGQYVAGTTRVTATTAADPTGLAIDIDGDPVTATVPSLEQSPVFTFEATNTDAFFRNGVRLGDEVLHIFDEGFYDRRETVATPIPIDSVVKGEPLTVGIYAGTKAWPQPDPNENNDDFAAFNVRLALPDGRVLRPTTCRSAGEGTEEIEVACPEPTTRIGFNDATHVYFLATFDIPDDAFDSIAFAWDTTAVTDGEHVVRATAGTDTVVRTVNVDNTPPNIELTGVGDGDLVRGAATVDATVTDDGAGVRETDLTATVDGAAVTLPYTVSALDLAPGAHDLVLTAHDAVGNTATRTVTFTTADEQPTVDLGEPADGAEVAAGAIDLSATVSSPESDSLTVRFREGDSFVPRDPEVVAAAGKTGTAISADRGDALVLDGAQLEAISSADGVTHEVASDTAFPYQLFTVAVPADAGEDARVRVAWEGTANTGAKVLMYVKNSADDTWEEVDRHIAAENGPFNLGALVPTAGHTTPTGDGPGEMTILVQHSEGFIGEVRSTRESTPTPYHPDATPRSAYDFTVAWESDTQYYNETDDYYPHQLAIHEFLLDQRDELNLQYLMHTGDVVNVSTEEYQWEKADAAYRLLDDAGLPYGVLAGNHDVGGHDEDYSHFSRWFGAARFGHNPWYGGDHLDNRGHYDLITAGGLDLLFLSMGWAPGDDQITWMNEVIARYPERKVVIELHEFMLTTGGLGPIPQRIMDEVVATNSNVFAVVSGHYHDAYTRVDDFDDDGDGTADRQVYSMLFDYQGLPEGGLGYLRLLHFDNVDEKIIVRTYSPSLDDFDSDDAALNNPPGMQEFEIPYAAGGLTPATKTLATDAFRVDVLTDRDIAVRSDVPSGSTVTVTWPDVDPGEHGWYVDVTGPYGGERISEIRTVAAVDAAAPAPVTPVIQGKAQVGGTVVVRPGRWEPATRLSFQWEVNGAPIPEATKRSFSITEDLIGQNLTVTVTGSGRGGVTVTTSDPVVVAPRPLRPHR